MRAGEAQALVAQHLFDDGVAPLIDFERVGLVEHRLAVVPLAGKDSPTNENIHFCQRGSSRFQRLCLLEDRSNQFVE